MLMRTKHSLVRLLLTSKASSVHDDPVSEQQDKAPVSHPASGAIGRGCAFASSRRVGAHALDKTTIQRKSVKRQSASVRGFDAQKEQRMRHERGIEALDLHPIIRCLVETRLAWQLSVSDIAGRMGSSYLL